MGFFLLIFCFLSVAGNSLADDETIDIGYIKNDVIVNCVLGRSYGYCEKEDGQPVNAYLIIYSFSDGKYYTSNLFEDGIMQNGIAKSDFSDRRYVPQKGIKSGKAHIYPDKNSLHNKATGSYKTYYVEYFPILKKIMQSYTIENKEVKMDMRCSGGGKAYEIPCYCEDENKLPVNLYSIGYYSPKDGGKEVEELKINGYSEGVTIWYYKDGSVDSILHHAKGLGNGLYTMYHKGSNKKEIECFMRNGKRHGSYTEYYLNGRLKNRVTYNDGLMTGPYKEYYENGKLKVETFYDSKGKQSGISKTYDEKGKLINKETYKNGFKIEK